MKEIFLRLFKEMLSTATAAQVISVDKSENTCDVSPMDGGADILDVQLRAAAEGTSGCVNYPSPGSIVLVAPIDNSKSSFAVIMFSEVEEIHTEIDKTKLIINKTGVTISKGNDSLKGILTDIVDQMLEIYAPKNAPGIAAIKININNLLKTD
ncbi:hypothetical protein ACR777_05340 [Sphingobacterium spiritivorum]|uniref:hypothetical protein n=1 Tax=Sphingobacterium spiritivorum TaxID=258 RepID=UPI003DA26CBD